MDSMTVVGSGGDDLCPASANCHAIAVHPLARWPVLRVLRDQICTTQGSEVDCVMQVEGSNSTVWVEAAGKTSARPRPTATPSRYIPPLPRGKTWKGFVKAKAGIWP